MKKIKNNISGILLVSVVFVSFFLSCNKNDDFTAVDTRLFRPVLNEELISENNTIIVNMAKMKEAVSYSIEVSRDSFASVVKTIETEENYYVIENLLWNTIYQVRATAHAESTEFNSKISDLGNVKTQRFPSIMGIPTKYDVTDVAGRVFWTTAGAAVTGVKVFASTDEALENPLASYNVNSDEQAAGVKIVPNLDPATSYQLAIFSESTVRGWENYTTKESLPSGDNVVDLRGITDNPLILQETLPTVADGSIILLEGGFVYTIDEGYYFDKSVTFKSGYSFDPAGATLYLNSNFNLNEGSNINSIVFEDLTLTSPDWGGKYVFNIDKTGTIGDLKFDNCKISEFRGVLRMKGGVGAIDKFTINNSIVNHIGSYGIFTVDKDVWQINDVLFKNSTFYQCIYFLVSKNNSNSIVIEDCTINDAPEKGRQLFRWRQGGQDDVLNGIFITNTIIGPGWNQNGEDDHAIDGFDGLGNTNFNIVNTHTTSEFAFAEGKDAIPSFPNFLYNGTVNDLWADPNNGDFNFIDSGFAGKGDAGDPRWRIGL